MFSIRKGVASACVAAAMFSVLALAGCGGGETLTGGVAATVNGTEIAEDKVTTYIQSLRDSQSITNDKDWANWLNNSGYTPETLREAVINMYVTQELEKEAAADQGIEISDDDVDAVVESMRSNYDTDEAWQNALESAGYSEESYRENVYVPMLEEQLLEAVIDEKDKKADDETVLQYVSLYAPSLDGMKRSSHILFSADDEATANDVLAQLNAGADFAALAQQYSSDGSAANGGDVGWNGLNTFVTAYSDALDKLSEGEISGLVTSEYGIHIIKCTAVWNAPEKIESLDQVPSEVVDTIRTQMADPATLQKAYTDYLQGLRDEADIQINDMPANVPYNVDMDRYISKSSSTEATDSASEGSSESADAEGDGAEGESADAEESDGESADGAEAEADDSAAAADDAEVADEAEADDAAGADEAADSDADSSSAAQEEASSSSSGN